MGGRLLHAYSLLKAEKYDGHRLTSKPIGRIYGMICTFHCIGILAAIVVVQAFLEK